MGSNEDLAPVVRRVMQMLIDGRFAEIEEMTGPKKLR
jgi:hypothetical protein